jgi:hypothetical protein
MKQRPEEPFVLKYLLPPAGHALDANIETSLLAYALLKLAGQVHLFKEDLVTLTEDYGGFTVQYNPLGKSFTCKLYTRTPEDDTTVRAYVRS